MKPRSTNEVYIDIYIIHSKKNKLTAVFMCKSALRLRGVFALRLISIVLLYAFFVCVFCFIPYCVFVKPVSCIVFANKHLEPWTLNHLQSVDGRTCLSYKICVNQPHSDSSCIIFKCIEIHSIVIPTLSHVRHGALSSLFTDKSLPRIWSHEFL